MSILQRLQRSFLYRRMSRAHEYVDNGKGVASVAGYRVTLLPSPIYRVSTWILEVEKSGETQPNTIS